MSRITRIIMVTGKPQEEGIRKRENKRIRTQMNTGLFQEAEDQLFRRGGGGSGGRAQSGAGVFTGSDIRR